MSHDGCAGSFSNGQEILNKVRMMGFSEQFLPMSLNINCKKCGNEFEMTTFEFKCPDCETIHCVTPCHAFDSTNVEAVI